MELTIENVKMVADMADDEDECWLLPCYREHELARIFIVQTHINVNFDRMIFFAPVTNANKLRDTFKYVTEILCTGKVVDDSDAISMPSTAELGLTFAFAGI
jgi:hypothetical protein